MPSLSLAKRTKRIEEIKSQLADLDTWISRARTLYGRENCPHYGDNIGKASMLRRELLKLRDPELYSRLYA